jgi:hypothetical protein
VLFRQPIGGGQSLVKQQLLFYLNSCYPPPVMQYLTLMVTGGVFDSETLNRNNSKGPEVKNTFYPRSIPHKMCYN